MRPMPSQGWAAARAPATWIFAKGRVSCATLVLLESWKTCNRRWRAMNADQRARRRRVLLILLLVGLGSCGAGKYAEHRSNQRLGFVADQGEVVGVSAHKTSGLW